MAPPTDGDVRTNEQMPETAIGRVCDRCRLRKIRCDRLYPCSNCQAVQKSCSSIGASQRGRESKQRVLISSQYEQKIDRIESRLERIEQLLRSDTSAPGARSGQEALEPSTMTTFTPPVDTAESTNSVSNQGDSEIAFEGDSSMAAATIFASEFVESAVERRPICNSNPPVKAALSSLKQITVMENCQSFEVLLPNKKGTLKGGLKGLAMPAVQSVLSILREINELSPISLTVISFFIPKERVVECCREIYFAMEDYSLSSFLIANAGLRYLFQEKAFAAVDTNSADEYRIFYRLCRDNLETALANLDFILPSNSENIEALLLGCAYAVEASKPLLAWQLVSGAAGMCQTLGWHRLDLNGDSATERKTSLFWLTYLLDKGLALRLGRSANIHDHEITLPKRLDKPSVPKGWQDLLGQWIRHSEIAGKAYQDLYSPAALRQSIQERFERANNLGAAMRRIRDEFSVPLRQAHAMETGPDFGSVSNNFFAMVLKADEVWYWTTMTLIHRAVPPTEGGYQGFSVACLQSARMAFGAHRECMQMTGWSANMKTAYLLWTIIYTPFVPFIVIFCNVIETSNPDDMRILGEFSESLKPIRDTSEAVQKLHDLCQVLYNVAVIYVEAKAQNPQDHEVPVENGFALLQITQFNNSMPFLSVATMGAAAPKP
ncbi:hypothetical protein AUP68_00676 [Ilyonectria robusta]